MNTRPLTPQQLDEIETRADAYADGHLHTKTLCNPGCALANDTRTLLAEIRRLTDRVAELETWAHGCDGEGCAIPHSSWCERAKKTAAENDGCTCPQPWQGHPQSHAGYCWLVSPPRNEIEEMRRALATRSEEAQQ